MGPLIFMARRHQIKRKKSTYQYRLLQVNNQRQQIAEQMGQANKAKAMRQSLFTTANQQAQNQLMRNMQLAQMFQQQASNQNYINTLMGANQFNPSNFVKLGSDGKYFLQQGANLPAGLKITQGANGEITQSDYTNLVNALDKAKNHFFLDNAVGNLNNGGLGGFGGLTMMMMQGMMGGSNLGQQIMNMAMDEQDEAELARLHVIDSQLEQEQMSLENQLKLLEAEEQAVEKQMDEEIKKSAPKFGLNG
ncbi:hypothetical protein J6Q66_02110 [bacterium]|nr:hypothetical protein [bacterium]